MNLFTVFSILSIFLFIVLIFLWGSYNNFITKRNQVKNDFSDIEVYLKRRADLIDQLVSKVKEYAKHEKETFENVTKARSVFDTSSSVKDMVKAENMFSQTLRSLFAVVENYPKLQANQSYQTLLENLKETENLIAKYREEYNNTVRAYNNSVQTFPSLLPAWLFRFYEEEFFSVNSLNL